MSEPKKKPAPPAQAPQGKPGKPNPAQNMDKQVPNNVVPLMANKCTAEECKKKPERAGFCSEHYTWFKEGLITVDGYKAKDFDKKYHAWLRRSQKAA